MARTAFDMFVLLVIETAISRRRMTRDNWHEHVRLDLAPDVRELLERPGQGVIVASAHIGNWEVAARAVSMIKPVTAIYRPFKNPYLDRSLQSSRSGENLHLVAKYEDDPMRFVRAISNGEILAIMIDQHARGGLPVEFFGREALTTPSIAMLHLVTRVPIVVAYALRTGPLTYEVHASGPFEFRRSGDRAADVLEITTALTREVETIARAHPEQYMWGHRRWKYHEKRARRGVASSPGASA
jgi:KDO2-lipid IV(A) lauroyltransferase